MQLTSLATNHFVLSCIFQTKNFFPGSKEHYGISVCYSELDWKSTCNIRLFFCWSEKFCLKHEKNWLNQTSWVFLLPNHTFSTVSNFSYIFFTCFIIKSNKRSEDSEIGLADFFFRKSHKVSSNYKCAFIHFDPFMNALKYIWIFEFN